jgi:hypothetical protein
MGSAGLDWENDGVAAVRGPYIGGVAIGAIGPVAGGSSEGEE